MNEMFSIYTYNFVNEYLREPIAKYGTRVLETANQRAAYDVDSCDVDINYRFACFPLQLILYVFLRVSLHAKAKLCFLRLIST